MDARKIETILTEQKEELKHLLTQSFCHRNEEKLVDMNSQLAQVITGIRRCGKSTLCINVLRTYEKPFAYLNFDDDRFININADDLNDILGGLYKVYGDFDCLFIDEIQNVDAWYLFVNRLLRSGMHLLITGSNSKLLSSELATHLTGRNHQIELFPFSFSEYCNYKNIDTHTLTTKTIAFLRTAFDDYTKTGGFPELLMGEQSEPYIGSLIDNIVQRDIVQRFGIRNKKLFADITNHLLNSAPMTIVYKRIQNQFEIASNHTAENYVNYLQQAYLIVLIGKYSAKSHIRIRNEKCYPIDVSFMNNRLNAFSGENVGWRLETIVGIHLVRRMHNSYKDVYYYADQHCEADFVVCNRNVVEMIVQVCYDISATKTLEREIAGLLRTSAALHCDNLWLITDHENKIIERKEKRITVMPAYAWLSNE